MDNSEQRKKQEREKKSLEKQYKKYIRVNKYVFPFIIIMGLFICGCLIVTWFTSGAVRFAFKLVAAISIGVFLFAEIEYMICTYENDDGHMQWLRQRVLKPIFYVCVLFFFVTIFFNT